MGLTTVRRNREALHRRHTALCLTRGTCTSSITTMTDGKSDTSMDSQVDCELSASETVLDNSDGAERGDTALNVTTRVPQMSFLPKRSKSRVDESDRNAINRALNAMDGPIQISRDPERGATLPNDHGRIHIADPSTTLPIRHREGHERIAQSRPRLLDLNVTGTEHSENEEYLAVPRAYQVDDEIGPSQDQAPRDAHNASMQRRLDTERFKFAVNIGVILGIALSILLLAVVLYLLTTGRFPAPTPIDALSTFQCDASAGPSSIQSKYCEWLVDDIQHNNKR
jgi:hypothetical protein